jgi:hypothetical protein
MSKQVQGVGPLAWEAAFAALLEPFLATLPRCTHRKWAPRYVEGLLGPGERKSMERIGIGSIDRAATHPLGSEQSPEAHDDSTATRAIDIRILEGAPTFGG